MARTTPRRDPVWVPVVSSASRTPARGGLPTGPTACSTPIVLPSTVTGVQTAEHGPFDESASWHTPGRSSLAGDHKGRDAVFAQFGRYRGVRPGEPSRPAELLHARDELEGSNIDGWSLEMEDNGARSNPPAQVEHARLNDLRGRLLEEAQRIPCRPVLLQPGVSPVLPIWCPLLSGPTLRPCHVS